MPSQNGKQQMKNKEIRAIPQVDAARLHGILAKTGWLATYGFDKRRVQHIWVQLGGQGPLLNRGRTLCERVLLPTVKGDWENVVYDRRHCPACKVKMELLGEIGAVGSSKMPKRTVIGGVRIEMQVEVILKGYEPATMRYDEIEAVCKRAACEYIQENYPGEHWLYWSLEVGDDDAKNYWVVYRRVE